MFVDFLSVLSACLLYFCRLFLSSTYLAAETGKKDTQVFFPKSCAMKAFR